MEAAIIMPEKKILRTTYGPTDEYGYSRMQTNKEIYNKFSVTVIKLRALEWVTALQAGSSWVRF
jgi:hypothetical protein